MKGLAVSLLAVLFVAGAARAEPAPPDVVGLAQAQGAQAPEGLKMWQARIGAAAVEIEGFLQDELLMVPAADLLKRMGQPYRFDKSAMQLTVLTSVPLRLFAGRPSAEEGQGQRPLSAAPVFAGGRFYVAVSDLARLLDWMATVDPQSRRLSVTGKITRMELRRSERGVELNVTTTGAFTSKTMLLKDPYRYVVDLHGLFWEKGSRSDPINLGALRGFRASQFEVSPRWIVRLVFDLDRPLVPEVSASRRELTATFYHQITDLVTSFEADQPVLRIGTTGALNAYLFYLQEPERVVVDMTPAILAMETRQVMVDHPWIKGVRFSQYHRSPSVVRAVVDLKQPATAALQTSTALVKLVLKEARATPLNQQMKIMVDAGHGGADPGAISPWGLKEKDVNLDIALRLADLLRSEGFEVMTTRDEDKTVELYSRPEQANQAGVHIFVSVHSNSLPQRSSKRGTEVYYHHEISRPLAEEVLKALVEITGQPDGGVRQRGFVVVKYTAMPSILVELAYLTNKEDEGLLREESFRQLSAQAIATGILRYLEKYPPGLLPRGVE